jgi:hypothetical protein
VATSVEGARVARPGAGGFVHSRREPENTALYKVLQQHLLTFEQEWTDKPSLPLSHYISWSELFRRTFEIDTMRPRYNPPLRLIAMIETEDTIKKILSAMGLPIEAPRLLPARPPPSETGGEGGDWLNRRHVDRGGML